ncbi:MAG: amidohydrolase family protein [Chloroflexi bacterium]|nr:amidohydrolase family protein [Chloroflexota bacterium]
MIFKNSPSVVFRNAQILSPTGIIGDSLRVEHGQIAALNAPPRPQDFVMDLEGALILPGIINAHEHLGVNNFGRLKYRDVYPNAHQWSLDIEARFESDPAITAPRAIPVADRLYIGGIKNLLAGATTVCHHDPWHPALDYNFPVRAARPFGYCHSLQRGGDIAKSYRQTRRGAPWIIHLAEGTDGASARELDQLDALKCLRDNTIIVHGVGLTTRQRRQVIERGAAMIWCPSSNFFLLGKTADVREFAAAGRVALGTDSRLTGDGDIWDELRAARATAQLSARDLFRLMTTDAAKILRLPRAGSIEIGAPADLIALPRADGDAFESLARIQRADVQLVMIAGKPLYGDPAFESLFTRIGARVARVRVDGREKLLAAKVAARLRRNAAPERGVEC